MRVITNGKIIVEKAILSGYALLYDEKICGVVPEKEVDKSEVDAVWDVEGAFVSPGFINMHIHGCAGYDAMDEAEEGISAMRRKLPETGVTAFLPTTITYNFPKIHQALTRLREAMRQNGGARILGAHLEGPFINVDYKGAHDPNYIVEPQYHLIEAYTDVIRLMTVAPEVIKEDSFINKCKDNNIILSIGHSAATYEAAKAAIQDGFTHITHMYNAMPVFNHRKPGVIGAAMDSDAVCELITDNVHVHPAMQRILLKEKGVEKIILVTDSMRACMLDEGEYELGGQTVIVKDNTAKLQNGVIAGSVLTMNRAVKNFWENTGIPLQDVVKMVTVNPAKELGIYHEIGSLAAGKKADFTIFNNQIEIMATIIDGEVAYRRK